MSSLRAQSAEESTGRDRPPLQHRAFGVGHDQLLEAVHDWAYVVGHHWNHRADARTRFARGHCGEPVVLIQLREDRLLPGDAAVSTFGVALAAEGLGADVEDDLVWDPVT